MNHTSSPAASSAADETCIEVLFGVVSATRAAGVGVNDEDATGAAVGRGVDGVDVVPLV